MRHERGMAPTPPTAETEIGVTVLLLRKGGTQMTAALLKKKLRGFPTGSLAVKTAGS